MDTELFVSEIFYSIQGESTHAGLPCIFIRLSGCNLRCHYCDSKYTWDAGTALTITAIMQQVEAYPCTTVEVTGGEPLQQAGCIALLKTLSDKGYHVLLETNGSVEIGGVPPNVFSILDVKCPDSGAKDSFHKKNIAEIQKRVLGKPGSCELKFVLSSKKDFNWACDFIHTHKLNNLLPLLFSPVQGQVSPQELASWIMQSSLAVRLQLQLHTILWPNTSRGV